MGASVVRKAQLPEGAIIIMLALYLTPARTDNETQFIDVRNELHISMQEHTVCQRYYKLSNDSKAISTSTGVMMPYTLYNLREMFVPSSKYVCRLCVSTEHLFARVHYVISSTAKPGVFSARGDMIDWERFFRADHQRPLFVFI